MINTDACRRLAEAQNGLITRDQALDVGLSRWLWQSGAQGLLEPVLPSVRRLVTPMTLTERRVQRSRAAVMIGGPGAVAFGASALRIAGIAGTPMTPNEDVAVDETCWYQRRGIHRHADVFTEAEVGVDRGTRYLLPSRSLQDVADSFMDADFLSVLDSALHLKKLTTATMAELGRCVPVRSRIMALADGRRESPLESRAALLMAGDHIQVRPQVPIKVASFGEVRVDFLIGEDVILEADGRESHDVVSARYADRKRHEALERMGYLIIRVTWEDVVEHPQATLARIRAAIHDATCRRRRQAALV